MTLSEALLGDFQYEAANTRKVLEAVPADRWDWKPHDKSMSLAQLAGHIAENPGWVDSMMADELDFGAMGDWKPFLPASRDELLSTWDKGVAHFTEQITGKDDAFMSGTWTMRQGEKVLMAMPRHVAIRGMALHHVLHHRGQLTVYLRLLEVPVPSTFGPSADDPGSFGG
jgi:uncharacterized damage-inducible protein DinB